MVESSNSELSIIALYTSSDKRGDFLPLRGFTYKYMSVIVSEKLFLVFL